MFSIVKKVIDRHDPYGLLAMGCPADEYDSESRDIASKINEYNSVDEIAVICSAVFTRWFGIDFLKESFIEIAEEIKSNLIVHYH